MCRVGGLRLVKAQTDRGESEDSLRDTGLIDSCCTVEQSMHCRARLCD